VHYRSLFVELLEPDGDAHRAEGDAHDEAHRLDGDAHRADDDAHERRPADGAA
jgi:hypothetical protein